MSYPEYQYAPQPPEPELNPKEIQFQNEKKDLRSRCNSIGLLVLLSSVAFLAFSVILATIYVALSLNVDLPKNIDSIPDNILNGLSNATIFGVFGMIFIKATKSKTSDVLIFEKVGAKKLIALLMIGFTVSMLSNFLTNLFLTNAYNFGIDLNIDIESPVSNSALEIIVYLVSTALVPAFSEEIVFRGVVLSRLRKYGDGFAVFVSAILFGLFHANFVQIPFAFVVGLVLGFTVVYTNSMLPAILIHMSNNAFAVISDVLYTNAESMGINEAILDVGSYIFVALIAIGALIAVTILSKRDKDFLKLQKPQGVLDNKTRTKMLLTSPTVIVATVFLLMESLMNHALV